MAASHDQHSGSHQLITNMGGWPRIPRTSRDAGGLSDDFVATVGNFAQLGNGCGGQVMLFGWRGRQAVPCKAL